MNILTNLVKRNLVLNKRRTVVTIISIILSCALIGGVATLFASFQRFMQDIQIEENGNYHAIFKNVPVSKSKYIENNAYIKTSMKSINLGYSILKESKNIYKPYLMVVAYDKQMFDNMPIHLLNGRLPKNSDELVISEHIATDGGVKYNIGDTITLNIGDRQSEGQALNQSNPYVVSESQTETFNIKSTSTYKIVGIIERPSSEPYSAPGYTVITYLDSKNLTLASKLDIAVLVKNPRDIYEKLDAIAKKNELPQVMDDVYDIDYNNMLLRWYGVTDNDDANSMLYGFALILIIVIMIASIIVIYNSFNISVTERKKQFGMLASIGSTSNQIRNMVLKEGLLLSLIGIPLGLISSFIGIGITLKVINNLGIFDQFYQSRLALIVSPLAFIATIFFGGLTIFLSSIIPAIKAAKTSPIDAIRLSNDIKIKGKKVKTSKLTRKIFGIEGELGLKNMKRNRKKYRSTIISLFVSIVLFMTVNSFADYSFKSSLKIYNSYNFNVGVMSDEETLKEISKFDYIDRYNISKSVSMNYLTDEDNLNSKIISNMKQNNYDAEKQKYVVRITLSTLSDTEFKHYIKENNLNLKDYTDPSNPRIIMIDKSNFRNINENKIYQISLTNLKEKDKMILTSYENDSKTMTIGSITSIYPLGFSNADSPFESIQGYISEEVYNSLDDSFRTGETIMTIQSSNPTKLIKEIKALGREKGIIINAQSIDEQVKLLNNMILAISIFLYGFITLVSLITITNVINTITTSIYLRRREFAMIKAVGMTDKDFNKMIRFESAFYGLKSLFYGLPMGILIDYFMYKNVGSIFIYDYELPLKPILICVAFVFAIISITMSYSVKKIKNDNIIDVIKQENV